MATAALFITIRKRWWGRLYLGLVYAILWSVAWALDDKQLDALIEKLAAFYARHGFVMGLSENDPGDKML